MQFICDLNQLKLGRRMWDLEDLTGPTFKLLVLLILMAKNKKVVLKYFFYFFKL